MVEYCINTKLNINKRLSFLLNIGFCMSYDVSISKI